MGFFFLWRCPVGTQRQSAAQVELEPAVPAKEVHSQAPGYWESRNVYEHPIMEPITCILIYRRDIRDGEIAHVVT